jgi:starch synthase
VKTLLAHPGTQYSHRLACQLNRVGSLYKFITGIAFVPDNWLLQWMPEFFKSKIANRILECSINSNQLKNIPAPELQALYRLFREEEMEMVIYRRNLSFQNKIQQKFLAGAEAVVGFDTSSWILAERAKKSDKPFFLDQSIAHPREKEKVYNDLRERYPDWSENILSKQEHDIQIEELEYSLATKIVVASSFTKDSLLQHGIKASKIVVNPYGVGKDFFRRKRNNQSRPKTRFLYLGLLGARKGLPLLVEAWKATELHQVAELWIAGPSSPFALTLVDGLPGASYKGKIPYREIPELLDECDCLVFPSFFEGFGQVILEAMAAGLPVITTDATAGPDIIEHGKDGYIIKAGDKDDLCNVLTLLANDRDLCYAMGMAATEKARGFSWEAYGDRWKEILNLERA